MDQEVAEHPSALESAAASAAVPGLGQLTQQRYVSAALHFGSVSAYLLLAFTTGHLWSWGAFAFNVWSMIDAAWWARGSGADHRPAAHDDADAIS